MSETWTINYEPSEGGRYTGNLTVKDDVLKFVAIFDSSNGAGLKTILAAVGALLPVMGMFLTLEMMVRISKLFYLGKTLSK